MGKLSVVLATFNEEKNIGDCLGSVRQLADEIVVVDGSSTDKTVPLARKYTQKIIITSNKPMFHINKQMAVDEATGSWILQLDADERVSKELAAEILEVVRKGSDYDAFWIPRKNLFLGKFLAKGGQYPDPIIRLFKKGKAHFPCKTVHEQMEVEGRVGWLKNDLVHLADPSFSRYLLRFNRYTTELATDLEKENLGTNLLAALNYLLIKPSFWFLLTFIRHKGFMDGFPGFVFSFFSSLRFPVAYIKYWEKKHNKYLDDLTSDWQ